MNGIRMDIQDEMIMLSPKNIGEAYQFALKEKEKLMRKQSGKGNNVTRGRGQQAGRGKFTSQKNGVGSSRQ